MSDTPNSPKNLNLSNYSYIIIDDERFARSLVKNTLSQIGCRDITEAGSAEEGADYLKSQHFNVILLDHKLPGASGLELCRALRAGDFGADNRQTPVIIITGDGRMETVLEAKESQINDFIIKPISLTELQKRLTKVLLLANTKE